MQKLIIIRGNSGSGKTSVAKELQRRLGRNTLVISQDTVRREMLWVNDGGNSPAIMLLCELLKYGYDHNEITILEGILNSKWYDQLFKLAVKLFKENIYAYYYDLPFDETLKRHETKTVKNEFGENEMRKWWNEKDYIGLIPEKTITKELSLEETVDMIFSDINS